MLPINSIPFQFYKTTKISKTQKNLAQVSKIPRFISFSSLNTLTSELTSLVTKRSLLKGHLTSSPIARTQTGPLGGKCGGDEAGNQVLRGA